MPRTLLVVVLAALLLVPSAAVASTSGVVVSQVYGGGGNSGATFRNDFVELFNGGAGAADLSGWSVQYATSAGTSWQTTPLTGSIAPGQYFLVQLASGGTVGAALPAPDATGTSNVAATSGKIALVRSTTALTCGATAGSCSATPGVEDLVGYGDATDFEGSGSAGAPSSTLSVVRGDGGCADTGDNANDFATAAPDPRNSAAAAHACAGTTSPGASGSAQVDVDVGSVLSVSLDRSSLSFGAAAAGTTPAPLPENVTVSSNNASGYSLTVARTAFTPHDLPLALGATAPAGGTLAPPLASGALAAIPVAPAAALSIGSKGAASATAGDVWPTRIGFSAPIPLVASGRYSATVTYTVVAR
ncbi:MAG TPA: lamin tail domain-containing protein [Gaiellaceae bacterium]